MAADAPMRIEPTEVLSPQQVLTRSAAVVLCSHLEGFFEALAGEYVDGIAAADPWSARSIGVKSFISVHAKSRLEESVSSVDTCNEPHLVDRFKESIQMVGAWFDDFNKFKAEVPKPWLRGFYRDNGPKAVQKLLHRLRPDQADFYDWLELKGHDRSTFWVSLEGLVGARNQVAHGNATLSFSVDDMRAYAAVCLVTVRQAYRYLT